MSENFAETIQNNIEQAKKKAARKARAKKPEKATYFVYKLAEDGGFEDTFITTNSDTVLAAMENDSEVKYVKTSVR